MGAIGKLTIVNGTPYTWEQVHIRSYQMNIWAFPQVINAGTTVTVGLEFNEQVFNTWTDDNGEVDFALQGVPGDIKFRLQVRYKFLQAFFPFPTLNHPQNSLIDLGFNQDGVVHFVLAGNIGQFTTIGPPASWMQANIKALGSRPLSTLCIPGSHDAGMSVITSGTGFANSMNTQTQTLSIGDQLVAGARWFDLRPVISAGIFKAGHYSNLGSPLNWQGANGQFLSDIIAQINNFTANNSELIIFNLSHAINTDAGSNYPDITQADWERLFGELTAVQNRFVLPTNSGQSLGQLTLNQYIGNGKPAVLFIVPSHISLGAFPSQGFYSSANLNVFDEYTGTNDCEAMVHDQLAKMRNNKGRYFLLSWTLTQVADQAVMGPSIVNLGHYANDTLYHDLFAACSKDLFPNVIYVDAFNPNVTSLAVAVNFLSVV